MNDMGKDGVDDADIATLARALAHPARLRILRLLAAIPGCIGGEIVEAVGLAQSTVSEHLRILKAAGLITGEIDRPRICYALNPAAVAPLTAFLTALQDTVSRGDCCIPTTDPEPKEPDHVDL
jgi:ArsR family transcriptional regulator